MSGLLPRFVLPADVRSLKVRLDPVVRSLDGTAASCAGLPDATRTNWNDFSKAWRAYFAEEDSWLHTAAQMDAGEAYERQIADWQRFLSTALCVLNGPQITPPSSTPDAHQDTIRTVAIAGAVIAVVVGIRSVMR
jgi:hypothetical protein